MKKFLQEAAAYMGASVCALAVDMGMLWVLVRFFSWSYLGASCLSFVFGATVAYILAVKFAFSEHRLRSRRSEFAGFVAIGTLGVAVNAGLMTVAVGLLGFDYIMAKCVAAAFTFVCNFIARRQLLFTRRSVA